MTFKYIYAACLKLDWYAYTYIIYIIYINIYVYVVISVFRNIVLKLVAVIINIPFLCICIKSVAIREHHIKFCPVGFKCFRNFSQLNKWFSDIFYVVCKHLC